MYRHFLVLLCIVIGIQSVRAQIELENFKVQYDSCRVNFNKGKYELAISWLKENMPAARFKQKEYVYWDMNNLLARALVKTGKTRRAEQQFLETIQFYDSKTDKNKFHPNLQSATINLAYLYFSLRQYDLAEIYYAKGLEAKKYSYSQKHPDYLAMVNNLGVIYQIEGRFAKSDSMYGLLLSLQKEIYSENSLEYIKTLYNRALLYKTQGRYLDAEPLFSKVVSFRRVNPGEKTPEYMIAYKHLGQIYAFQRRYAEAEPIMLRLVELNKTQYGEKHKEYTEALNNLGSLYIAMEKYEDAEKIFLQVSEIRKNTLGKNHIDYASALSNLGLLYRKMSKYTFSEKYYKRSLEIYESNVGKKHNSYVSNLVNLASLYREMGRFLDAENRYNKSKQIFEETIGKDKIEYAGLLSNMALFYTELGKYDIAEDYYKESLSITEMVLGIEHPEYATTLNNLASLYKTMGRYEEAEGIYTRSADIRKRTIGERNYDYATSMNNLGALYEIMGRYKDAEMHYLLSLSIIKLIFGDRHPVYANQLNNLAGLYEITQEYEQAERMYTEALEIQAEKLGEKHPDYVLTLNNLALLQQKNGNFEKAEELYRKNLNKSRALYGVNHPAYGTALMNLASLYEATAKYKEAEKLYVEALGIRKEVLGEKHPAYGNTLTSLARLYAVTQQYIKSDSAWFKAIRLDLYEIQKYFPSMSEKEKAEFYATIKEYFEQFNTYAIIRAPKDPSILGKMYNYQLATKALLLNSSSKLRNSILSSNDSVLIHKFKDWLNQKEFLGKVYAMSREDIIAQHINVDSLEREVNNAERELSQSSQIFKDASEIIYYTWQDVKKTLKPGEAAIEIIRFPKFKFDSGGVYSDSIFYAALVVKPTTQNNPELILIREGNVMETKLLRYYRNSIKNQTENEFCYAYYWKPIAENLKGYKKVYVSLDGAYNQINLNTLKNMKTKQFVLDEIEIQVVANTKDLIQKKSTPNQERSIVLCGNPNFLYREKSKKSEAGYDESGNVVKYQQTLAPLPGTEQEVKQIDYLASQNSWNSKVYTGVQVTEDRVKSIPSPKVLHIATHGFFDNDVKGQRNKNQATKVSENPLLKSGLMLAGSDITLQNKRNGYIIHNKEQREDGILTAYEAMNLKLDHTDLVVLSACETGLGEVKNGEGVYGLQRSFQVAGAKTIINSLWTVNDQTTMLLMTNFYKKWFQSGDKRKAFKEAMLAVRQQFPDPYYWGAFVMLGE